MRQVMIVCVVAALSFEVGGCTSSNVNAESKSEIASSTQPSASAVRAECPNFKDVIVKQQTPVWCWAASSVMVRKYYNASDPITQEQLAQDLTLAGGDDPAKAKAAGLQQIMVALNPDYTKRVAERSGQMIAQKITTRDGSFGVNYADLAIGQVAQWSASSDDLVDAITSSNPAIVGLRNEGASMGHAVVVYATRYEPVRASVSKSMFGSVMDSMTKTVAGEHGIRADQVDAVGVTKGPAKYKLAEVEYVDPMDGKRYKLNAQGFKNRVDFIMTRDRAREILDRQLGAVG